MAMPLSMRDPSGLIALADCDAQYKAMVAIVEAMRTLCLIKAGKNLGKQLRCHIQSEIALAEAAAWYAACEAFNAGVVACQAVAGAAKYVFDSMADAAKWLAAHPEIAIGTVVVVAGVTYVVATGGTGLILVPAAAGGAIACSC